MFGLFNKKTQEKNEDILSGSISIVGAINDGVVVIGCDKKIAYVNPSVEKIIGWSSADAQNLQYYSVLQLCDLHGEEIPVNKNPVEKAINHLPNFAGFSSREIFLKTISDKIIPVDMAISLIEKNRCGVVVVFRNIAKEIKENREQAEFISTASHEMRTPVASIEGYLGLALNPSTATIDDRARDYLTKAYENTRHLGNLFRDLLEVTRAEDGRLKNDPKIIDAVEFTRNIWQGLQLQAAEKGLEYRFLLDRPSTGEKHLSPVFYVNVDQDHLQEAISNLIENALKYTPNGSVDVNVFNENSLVKITVADTGIGIPAEDIPHLFQKFYRVDNSDTREIGGTGLGLYLCRRLIEAMGGSLTVESEYKKGSIFTISLPRVSTQELEQFKRRAAEESLTEQENNKLTPTSTDESIDLKENENFSSQPESVDLSPKYSAISDRSQQSPQAVQATETAHNAPPQSTETKQSPPPTSPQPQQSTIQSTTVQRPPIKSFNYDRPTPNLSADRQKN